MNKDAPHPRELVGVCGAFALDAPPGGFNGLRVGPYFGPPPHDNDPIRDGLPR